MLGGNNKMTQQHGAPDSPTALAPRGGLSLKRLGVALLIAAVVALVNLLVWRAFNPPLAAAQAAPQVAGLAYNAFQRWDSPLGQRFPNDTALAADLKLLATLTKRIRTYSALEFPALPALAQRAGLAVSLGVWLDTRQDNNAKEVAAALEAARQHRSVERVIAGNETQLHQKLTPEALYATLDRLRAALDVPVSTAEPWHVWLGQPELARHVDFITVHLLPYWEGVPVEAAVDDALMRYRQVQDRFPRKAVVIGEIGWPSGGPSVGVAHATPDRQAAFVRAFLARAANLNLDYHLMEAVDQPWKRATEGPVGAHWGLLNAARHPKFDFVGPVQTNPYWPHQALGATLLGLLLLVPFLLTFARMRLVGRLAFVVSLQAVASLAVMMATRPLDNYLRWQEALWLTLMVPALLLMAAIVLTHLFEFAELFWRGSLRQQTQARAITPGTKPPFVSIHVACCNEPPNMVIATLNSLMALDWPAFEVVVVDNNTTDAACWLPVQAHAQALMAQRAQRGDGPLVHFLQLGPWPGFKAGALNEALRHTNPQAQWVAVVDADYVVQPQWLRAVMGHGESPDVAAIQSPQAHRDWATHPLRRMMNWEYDGFFRIGMHHRHERNAIVQHGTMTVVRAALLRSGGGWDEACICEDTELGLRLLQQGGKVVYVDQVLGTGLVPSDFAAYQRQRRRWALGAVQILRKHAQALLWPGAQQDTLHGWQRYHFVAGWLPWLGDAMHLVFSVAAMLWSVGLLLAPQWIHWPLPVFVLPLAVFFGVRLLLVPLLYARRVPCRPADIAGAAMAGMSLSHSVARGVFAGLLKQRAAFDVTRKGPAGDGGSVDEAAQMPLRQGAQPRARHIEVRPSAWHSVREEAAMLMGLSVCFLVLAVLPTPLSTARAGWLAVLALQAVPYAAALGCAWLSWRKPKGAATMLAPPRRAVVAAVVPESDAR